MQRIKEMLFQRRKIEAIKLYREFTGEGLAVSKAAVERIEAELQVAAPEKFRAPDAHELSSVAIIIGVTIVVIVTVWLMIK